MSKIRIVVFFDITSSFDVKIPPEKSKVFIDVPMCDRWHLVCNALNGKVVDNVVKTDHVSLHAEANKILGQVTKGDWELDGANNKDDARSIWNSAKQTWEPPAGSVAFTWKIKKGHQLPSAPPQITEYLDLPTRDSQDLSATYRITPRVQVQVEQVKQVEP